MEPIAFELWYVQEHPRLVAALTIIAGDVALAADATDEAFARAYERWERVRVMESPGGWTYRTALNLVRGRWRRAAREAHILGRAPTIDVVDWSPEVWDALRRLPRRERTAIALRYVADLTTEEIAVAMQIAVGTVGSTLHAARRNLAGALGDSDVEPEPVELPPEDADASS